MKKYFALFWAVLLCLSLTACGEPDLVFDNSLPDIMTEQSSVEESSSASDVSSLRENYVFQSKPSSSEDTSSEDTSSEDTSSEDTSSAVTSSDVNSDATTSETYTPPTLYVPDPTSAMYEKVMAQAMEKLGAYDGSQENFSITLENPFGISDSEVQSFFHDLIQHAVREDGEAYWMLPGLSTTTYNANTRTVTYKPYIYEQFQGSKFSSSQKVFYAALEEVTAEVFQPGMSDVEKILSAWGWLCNNTVYDSSMSYDSYNAYSALVDKTSICNGYMVTFNLLMKKAGIDCYMSASTTEIDNTWHVWNVVKLNGKWYALDATQGNVYGSTSYHHFLVSDKDMLSDGTHLESDTRLGITCNDDYAGDTPWKTTCLPFTYSEKYGALVNLENYEIVDGVTYVAPKATYRKVKIDANGNARFETIATIPQYVTSCTREYHNELLFITYDGALMTYRLSDGACYEISSTNHKGQYVYIEGSLLMVCDGSGNVTARYQLAEE